MSLHCSWLQLRISLQIRCAFDSERRGHGSGRLWKIGFHETRVSPQRPCSSDISNALLETSLKLSVDEYWKLLENLISERGPWPFLPWWNDILWSFLQQLPYAAHGHQREEGQTLVVAHMTMLTRSISIIRITNTSMAFPSCPSISLLGMKHRHWVPICTN